MAKKFNFKLESVLKYRADKVNQATESLNQIVKIRNEKEQEIQQNEEKKQVLFGTQKGKIKAADLQNKNNHINFLNDEIERLNEEKKQVLEIENLRRKKLTSAMKDEKVIDKLKDKQKLAHDQNQKKEEGAFLDEIGLQITMKNRDKHNG
ncbi:MAG: flagellar FliJ family protein [Candidatus Kapabacteria bacterium]|nr:flagellar FliJ family protein [Ignavibacteriota bacterium]MCW5886039.1 flagellar FliJ family protein [Candidatus Kapabacteria bacterium]